VVHVAFLSENLKESAAWATSYRLEDGIIYRLNEHIVRMGLPIMSKGGLLCKWQ